MFGGTDKLFGLLNNFNQLGNIDLFIGMKKGLNPFAHKNHFGSNRLTGGRSINIPQSINPFRNTDILDISPKNKPAGINDLLHALYTPEDIINKPLNSTPVPSEFDQPPPQEEITEKRFLNLVDLNLNFSLEEFETTLVNLIEDAGNGEIDAATFANANVGLNIGFMAKAQSEEISSSTDNAEQQTSIKSLKENFISNQAMNMMMKSRAFEAEMFYQESLKTSYKLKSYSQNGFVRVSRKLAMHYTQDFSFNFKSLNLYNTQAVGLEETGDTENYLQQTEALTDNSQATGELIGQFFETVQGYLDSSEEKLIEKINMFFDKLTSEMEIDPENLDFTRQNIIASATAFFDEVEQAISSVQSKYLPEEEPVDPIPEPEQTPVIEPPVENEPVPEDFT